MTIGKPGAFIMGEKPAMEREQVDWDVLRHARWYVSAYHPLTRTMAQEQSELLAKMDAALSLLRGGDNG